MYFYHQKRLKYVKVLREAPLIDLQKMGEIISIFQHACITLVLGGSFWTRSTLNSDSRISHVGLLVKDIINRKVVVCTVIKEKVPC